MKKLLVGALLVAGVGVLGSYDVGCAEAKEVCDSTPSHDAGLEDLSKEEGFHGEGVPLQPGQEMAEIIEPQVEVAPEPEPVQEPVVEQVKPKPAARPKVQTPVTVPQVSKTVPWDGGVCHEDMSCWDCPTMGNRQCGPGAPEWMQDGDPSTGPEEEV